MTKNKVVIKSMNILQLFEHSEALSINEMVTITNLPKTSVMRMVSSLEDMGFLSKRSDRRYVLGLSLLHYGHLVAERLDLRKVALPLMNQLRDEMDEAVNLSVPEEEEAIYVEKVDARASQMVRVFTRIGRRAPFYAGACPRIILANMDEDRVNAYLESIQPVQIASGTITDKSQLREVLVKCRQDGYSISFSELENGAAAIAAPIFNHKGEVIAGLSITGPDYRFREYLVSDVIQRVMHTAAEISKRVGWNPDTLKQMG